MKEQNDDEIITVCRIRGARLHGRPGRRTQVALLAGSRQPGPGIDEQLSPAARQESKSRITAGRRRRYRLDHGAESAVGNGGERPRGRRRYLPEHRCDRRRQRAAAYCSIHSGTGGDGARANRDDGAVGAVRFVAERRDGSAILELRWTTAAANWSAAGAKGRAAVRAIRRLYPAVVFADDSGRQADSLPHRPGPG